MMLRLGKRVRGHFVTLIEIGLHLIRVIPGHIVCCDYLYKKYKNPPHNLQKRKCCMSMQNNV